MTDTARTLAAVKQLFADNSVGAISPQDLRDFVEPIVNPIPDGVFQAPEDRTFVSHRQNPFNMLENVYSLYDPPPQSALSTLAAGSHVYVWDLREQARDSANSLGAKGVFGGVASIGTSALVDNQYYGATFPAGTYVTVDPGVYSVSVGARPSALTSTDTWEVFFDFVN